MSDERENTIKETAVGKLLGMNFFIYQEKSTSFFFL